MDTQKDSEKKMVSDSDHSVPEVSEGTGISRRKFTRNALYGSAVLLTLSNRSAWGGAEEIMCISNSLLASFDNLRTSALTEQQNDEVLDFMAVRDNTSPQSHLPYRTGEVDVGPVETCFPYKP